ncbi:undecaprenyl-diphosphate phosphatase [Marinomonas ostreistagni]|uniref:undecaprenyl-diphosphate phosphatase n=1 Tax=Marinomonas ostreistagni TaxID=359209 RepID=UPI001951BEDA|nr:undecaprenyl-diphosphate phosphatase [Marinomonas ostreistagni]MBM6551647.1 undecaprenyl-diphosphate phosphatase [Marinomonas ostreistagni]
MLWYHVLILALVQGLTEFLPISSSAHLILPAKLLHWQDQGLAFDVAVHFGTLIAVVWFFRHDLKNIAHDWLRRVIKRRERTDNSRLGWWVIIATLPALVLGLILDNYIQANLRSMEIIAYTTIGFGVLLWLSDRFAGKHLQLNDLTLGKVLFIGFAQALALIPGTSRSGITMTAARYLGFGRECAARFSFLLSVPIIVAAAGFKTCELMIDDSQSVDWWAMAWGVVLSAISAYLCITIFLKWLNRIGFLPFMIYRLVLGALLLWVVNVGG